MLPERGINHIMNYRQFLNKREKPSQLNITVSPAEISSIDRGLNYAAHASQIGLLILAIFGYFYTVVPVYEKNLLDEEIAKKEIELSIKNDELNALNKATSEIKTKLHSSNIEAKKLRKTVSNQYEELLYRLIDEFQFIANSKCRVDTISEKLFSTCVKEKVITSYNLHSMNQKDKKLLLKLSKNIDTEISKIWLEKNESIKKDLKNITDKRKIIESNCKERQNDPDYKGNKKIEMDYACKQDIIKNDSESIHIRLNAIYDPQDITNDFTSKIKNEFIKQIEK